MNECDLPAASRRGIPGASCPPMPCHARTSTCHRAAPRLLAALLLATLLTLAAAAAQAAPIRVFFERDQGGQAGNELAIVSYPSLADMVANTVSITQFTQIDIDPAFSLGGSILDGSTYRLLFERDSGGTAGNELAIVSYPTLPDLIDNTVSITQFSLVDIDPAFSVAGFAYDGSAYRVLFERDSGGTAGNELAIVSYPTLPDLIDNTISTTRFTQIDVDPNYSAAGFVFDSGVYRILFERDADGQAGNDLAIVSYPSLSDLIDNTISITQFTQIDIDPAFSVAGVLIEPDVSGDPGGGGGNDGGGTVSEPSSLSLILITLACLTWTALGRSPAGTARAAGGSSRSPA